MNHYITLVRVWYVYITRINLCRVRIDVYLGFFYDEFYTDYGWQWKSEVIVFFISYIYDDIIHVKNILQMLVFTFKNTKNDKIFLKEDVIFIEKNRLWKYSSIYLVKEKVNDCCQILSTSIQFCRNFIV